MRGACGRARADTYDIINACVRLSWCLYSRRYYETPSENVLRFVSPFILFCFNWMVGAKSRHMYVRATFTTLHAAHTLNGKMSNRRLASLSLSFCRAESLTRGTPRRKNSNSRVILVHVINRAFQHRSTDLLSLNRVVQTYIPLSDPWNFKLFSTSLQSCRKKNVACVSLRTLRNK